MPDQSEFAQQLLQQGQANLQATQEGPLSNYSLSDIDLIHAGYSDEEIQQQKQNWQSLHEDYKKQQLLNEADAQLSPAEIEAREFSKSILKPEAQINTAEILKNNPKYNQVHVKHLMHDFAHIDSAEQHAMDLLNLMKNPDKDVLLDRNEAREYAKEQGVEWNSDKAVVSKAELDMNINRELLRKEYQQEIAFYTEDHDYTRLNKLAQLASAISGGVGAAELAIMIGTSVLTGAGTSAMIAKSGQTLAKAGSIARGVQLARRMELAQRTINTYKAAGKELEYANRINRLTKSIESAQAAIKAENFGAKTAFDSYRFARTVTPGVGLMPGQGASLASTAVPFAVDSMVTDVPRELVQKLHNDIFDTGEYTNKDMVRDILMAGGIGAALPYAGAGLKAVSKGVGKGAGATYKMASEIHNKHLEKVQLEQTEAILKNHLSEAEISELQATDFNSHLNDVIKTIQQGNQFTPENLETIERLSKVNLNDDEMLDMLSDYISVFSTGDTTVKTIPPRTSWMSNADGIYDALSSAEKRGGTIDEAWDAVKTGGTKIKQEGKYVQKNGLYAPDEFSETLDRIKTLYYDATASIKDDTGFLGSRAVKGLTTADSEYVLKNLYIAHLLPNTKLSQEAQQNLLEHYKNIENLSNQIKRTVDTYNQLVQMNKSGTRVSLEQQAHSYTLLDGNTGSLKDAITEIVFELLPKEFKAQYQEAKSLIQTDDLNIAFKGHSDITSPAQAAELDRIRKFIEGVDTAIKDIVEGDNSLFIETKSKYYKNTGTTVYFEDLKTLPYGRSAETGGAKATRSARLEYPGEQLEEINKNNSELINADKAYETILPTPEEITKGEREILDTSEAERFARERNNNALRYERMASNDQSRVERFETYRQNLDFYIKDPAKSEVLDTFNNIISAFQKSSNAKRTLGLARVMKLGENIKLLNELQNENFGVVRDSIIEKMKASKVFNEIFEEGYKSRLTDKSMTWLLPKYRAEFKKLLNETLSETINKDGKYTTAIGNKFEQYTNEALDALENYIKTEKEEGIKALVKDYSIQRDIKPFGKQEAASIKKSNISVQQLENQIKNKQQELNSNLEFYPEENYYEAKDIDKYEKDTEEIIKLKQKLENYKTYKNSKNNIQKINDINKQIADKERIQIKLFKQKYSHLSEKQIKKLYNEFIDKTNYKEFKYGDRDLYDSSLSFEDFLENKNLDLSKEELARLETEYADLANYEEFKNGDKDLYNYTSFEDFLKAYRNNKKIYNENKKVNIQNSFNIFKLSEEEKLKESKVTNLDEILRTKTNERLQRDSIQQTKQEAAQAIAAQIRKEQIYDEILTPFLDKVAYEIMDRQTLNYATYQNLLKYTEKIMSNPGQADEVLLGEITMTPIINDGSSLSAENIASLYTEQTQFLAALERSDVTAIRDNIIPDEIAKNKEFVPLKVWAYDTNNFPQIREAIQERIRFVTNQMTEEEAQIYNKTSNNRAGRVATEFVNIMAGIKNKLINLYDPTKMKDLQYYLQKDMFNSKLARSMQYYSNFENKDYAGISLALKKLVTPLSEHKSDMAYQNAVLDAFEKLDLNKQFGNRSKINFNEWRDALLLTDNDGLEQLIEKKANEFVSSSKIKSREIYNEGKAKAIKEANIAYSQIADKLMGVPGEDIGLIRRLQGDIHLNPDVANTSFYSKYVEDIQQKLFYKNAECEKEDLKILGFDNIQSLFENNVGTAKKAYAVLSKFGAEPFDFINMAKEITKGYAETIAPLKHGIKNATKLKEKLTAGWERAVDFNLHNVCGTYTIPANIFQKWTQVILRFMSSPMLMNAGFKSFSDYNYQFHYLVNAGLASQADLGARARIEGQLFRAFTRDKEIAQQLFMNQMVRTETLYSMMYNASLGSGDIIMRNKLGLNKYAPSIMKAEQFTKGYSDIMLNTLARIGPLTDYNRTNAALTTMKAIASISDRTYKDLPKNFQQTLTRFGISETEWNTIFSKKLVTNSKDYISKVSGNEMPDVLNYKMFFPDLVDQLSDKDLSALMKQNKLSETKIGIQKYRTYLKDKASLLINTSADEMTSIPKSRIQGALTFNALPNTFQNFFMNTVMQFQSFGAAVNFYQWGRRLAAHSTSDSSFNHLLFELAGHPSSALSIGQFVAESALVEFFISEMLANVKGTNRYMINDRGEFQGDVAFDKTSSAIGAACGLGNIMVQMTLSMFMKAKGQGGGLSIPVLPAVSRAQQQVARITDALTKKSTEGNRGQAVAGAIGENIADIAGLPNQPLAHAAYALLIGDSFKKWQYGDRYNAIMTQRAHRGYAPSWLRRMGEEHGFINPGESSLLGKFVE